MKCTKKVLTLALGIALVINAQAGEIKYPVSSIPEELKQNVDAVVREDFKRFTILSKNHAQQVVRFVVTILNERGNDHAEHSVDYDRLTKVVDISGAVYDANGKPIKKLKNKDISDRVSYDGASLFTDNRVKTLDLSQAVYPYTVEIEYELEFKFLLSIPSSWWGGERVSYQRASYELAYPTELRPDYKLLNINSVPSKKI